MKSLIFTFCIIFIQSMGLTAQNLERTITNYSKTQTGTIGKETFTFTFKSPYIYKFDTYYESIERYGPLILEKTGFNQEGFYYELLQPDTENNILEIIEQGEMRAYNLVYSEKGGKLLFIAEIKQRRGRSTSSTKIYYTDEGYKIVEKYQDKDNKITRGNAYSENNQKEFDILNAIIQSDNLYHIFAKISLSCEKVGDGNKSKDGKYLTVRYDVKKNVSSLVTYNMQEKIEQIVFLLPEHEAQTIIEDLIDLYGVSEEEGDEFILKGDYRCMYGVDEGVGIIVID